MKNPESIIRGIMHEAVIKETHLPPSGVEGDYEGDMALGELRSIISNAEDLLNDIGEKQELEAWVQAKITKAADYISSVRNYMEGQKHRLSHGVHESILSDVKKHVGSIDPKKVKKHFKNDEKAAKEIIHLAQSMEEQVQLNEKAEAWQRKEGKNPEGGLNKKGVASYRKSHPGSKLQTAVTTEPSKLKAGSKKAKRRKSFCARMKGMKKRLTSAKTARDPDSRINKSLRKWNCE